MQSVGVSSSVYLDIFLRTYMQKFERRTLTKFKQDNIANIRSFKGIMVLQGNIAICDISSSFS